MKYKSAATAVQSNGLMVPKAFENVIEKLCQRNFRTVDGFFHHFLANMSKLKTERYAQNLLFLKKSLRF